MHTVLFVGLFLVINTVFCGFESVSAQAPGKPPVEHAKTTAAAELTRTKLLKAKVTAKFMDVRLGEILKEFAAQVNMQTEQHLLWTYGKDFPFSQKVTFAVEDQPLDAALDQLLTKTVGTLGYVIVSKSGNKYDGWVRLTTTGERGAELPPATAQEEQEAADTLTKAKGHIDGKNVAAAKVYLQLVVKKYPTSKAAGEAKALLEKFEK